MTLLEPGAPTTAPSGELLAGPATPHAVWAGTTDMAARAESAEAVEESALVSEHRRVYRLRHTGAAARMDEGWAILDEGETWDIRSVGRDERIRARLVVVAERRRAVTPGGG